MVGDERSRAAAGWCQPLNVFPDVGALSRALAHELVSAVSRSSRFTIALAGGRTPRLFYRLLATEFRREVPWARIHLFWSDERYVPSDDPASNVGMARASLIDHVPIPAANVHPPRTDATDIDDAARWYEENVRKFLGNEPRFDWMLLGLGEDGHTASIFPGAPANDERERLVVAVRDSPKPPPMRLTMTPPLINRSHEVHLLAAGASKRQALERVANGTALPWLSSKTLWVDRDAWNVE